MQDCIFCKIIKKEIPAEIVYEDENAIAILDINPANYGHTLVMPKKHFDTFGDTSQKILCQLIPVVQKIGNALINLEDVDAYNVLINNGKTAGQLVFHLHIHIIPRLINDGLKHWPNKSYQNEEQKKEYTERIKRGLNNLKQKE